MDDTPAWSSPGSQGGGASVSQYIGGGGLEFCEEEEGPEEDEEEDSDDDVVQLMNPQAPAFGAGGAGMSVRVGSCGQGYHRPG